MIGSVTTGHPDELYLLATEVTFDPRLTDDLASDALGLRSRPLDCGSTGCRAVQILGLDGHADQDSLRDVHERMTSGVVGPHVGHGTGSPRAVPSR